MLSRGLKLTNLVYSYSCTATLCVAITMTILMAFTWREISTYPCDHTDGRLHGFRTASKQKPLLWLFQWRSPWPPLWLWRGIEITYYSYGYSDGCPDGCPSGHAYRMPIGLAQPRSKQLLLWLSVWLSRGLEVTNCCSRPQT